jgi:hypothetical protein
MSTGAIALYWSVCSAAGSSARNARRNSPRVTLGASPGRMRHTRITEEASALEFWPRNRLECSVRIGHVPIAAVDQHRLERDVAIAVHDLDCRLSR